MRIPGRIDTQYTYTWSTFIRVNRVAKAPPPIHSAADYNSEPPFPCKQATHRQLTRHVVPLYVGLLRHDGTGQRALELGGLWRAESHRNKHTGETKRGVEAAETAQACHYLDDSWD